MGVVRRTISPHAAPLRRDATDAERALWFELRARRLGGHKFRRQWTLGPYVVDFCCLESGLVVEIDGGQHTTARNQRRTEALRAKGFRLIRFWNHDVLANMDGVLTALLEALGGQRNGQQDPHPGSLPLAGDGE